MRPVKIQKGQKGFPAQKAVEVFGLRIVYYLLANALVFGLAALLEKSLVAGWARKWA